MTRVAVRGGDVALVAVLVALAVVEYLVERPPSRLEAIAVATTLLALLLRRAHPVAVTCVAAASTAVVLAAAPPALVPNVAMLLAAYSGVVHAAGRSALAAVCAASVAGWSTGMALTPADDLGNRVVSAAWIVVPLLLGAVVRSHVVRAAAAERRTAETAAVLAEERDRIAREMHDVVAHALAVVVLHARGGREALRHGDAGAAEAAFGVVEDSSRQALGDMRRLVTLIRAQADDDAPAPSLRALGALLDSVRAAGLRVDARVHGDPSVLPAGVDAAAYRLVQEALTNVMKHAGGAPAQVRVDVADDGVELEILDDGQGEAGEVAGHGLVGMRERVTVYGGRFECGPRPGGGFRVWARMPLGAA